MQEQEWTPQSQQQADKHVINTDPREQQTDQETYDYEQSYDKGYTGPQMNEMWDQDEGKLQPKRRIRWQGWEKLLILLAVVAGFIVVAYLTGLLTNWLLWLVLTGGVVVAAFFVIFFIVGNWHVMSLPMPIESFQVPESPQLVINHTSGTISLRRGEPGIVSVAATKKASGVGATAQKMQVQYQQQDRILHISTKTSWNVFELVFRSVDLEITVPDHCDLVVRNGSGRMTVQSVHGNIQLKTGNGSITVNDVQGQVDLQTGSGSLSASQVDGTLQLKTGSGRISVQRAQLRSNSRLKTGSGSISFDGSLGERGDYQFSTGSGSIGVRLPWDASFRLHAKTGLGSIINDFGSTQVNPEPDTQLSLRTGSGSIVVSRNTTV